jgi:hypothetical protein
MKKCLRSVNYVEDKRYEYLRVDVEEAKEMVETGKYIYISKEEYKRKSRYYKMIPCQGTLINTIDARGNKRQELIKPINYEKQYYLSIKLPNSSKIGKGSINSSKVLRKNKFNGNFNRR